MGVEILKLPDDLFGFATALAVGMIVGLERGWRDRDVPDGGRVAGLRTFALVGLLGAVLCLSGTWALAAGTAGVAVLIAVAYKETVRASGNLSITSAIAQFLTFGLGALAGGGLPVTALAVAVIVAVLLNLRSTLHRWLTLIEQNELNAAMQMLVLSAVILPLLPNASFGPFGALNPYRLWWAVVLVAGLSLAGHVAMRMGGPQRGTLWTGLLGGLASSTATTLALSRKVRVQPALRDAALAGIWSACAVMFVRMTVLVMALSQQVGILLMWPMLTASAVLLIAGVWQWRTRQRTEENLGVGTLNPFDLGTALGFGAFLGLMSVFAEAVKTWLGTPGLYALALLAGIADVDVITVSLSRMDTAGSVTTKVAAWSIALAVLSNMCVKAFIAGTAGGSSLGLRVASGYALALLPAGTVLAVVMTFA